MSSGANSSIRAQREAALLASFNKNKLAPDPKIAEMAKTKTNAAVKQGIDQIADRLLTQPMSASNPTLAGKPNGGNGVALKATKHPRGKKTRRRGPSKAALEVVEVSIDPKVMAEAVQHWKKRAVTAETILASQRKKALARVKRFRKKAKT